MTILEIRGKGLMSNLDKNSSIGILKAAKTMAAYYPSSFLSHLILMQQSNANVGCQ